MRTEDSFLGKGAWGCVLVLFAMLVPLSCAPKQQVTVKPGTTSSPRVQTEAKAAQRPAASYLDPSLVQREIQRRREALSMAKGRLEPSSGTASTGELGALDAWVRATEGQVARLEMVQKEMQGLPFTTDPSERAKRSQRMAEQLLECLAIAPLDPPLPVPEAKARIREETRVSWDILRNDYARGDCSAVLQEYRAVTGAHQGVGVPADVQLKRALCLSRTGKRREAIQVLEQLLAGGENLIDTQQVQYHVANWLFEEGELDKAAQRYQALLEGGGERQRWADLARLRMEQIRLRKGEGASSQPAERPAELAPGASPALPPQEAGFNGKQPVQRPPGQEAHVRPTGPPSLSIPAEIPKASPEFPQSDAPPPKATEPTVQGVQLAKVQEAQRLLDGEKYEEAIRAFQEVEGGEFDAEAKKGIQEAQDRYADKRRREAASLVLKAHGETPAGNRKALLVQALQILKETNARYPGNKYASKIEQNIQDVTQQIRKMDPEFKP